LVHQHDAAQASVRFAQRAPALSSPDFIAAELASTMLGGVYDSRLNHALRHGEGATYGVTAQVASFRDFGLLLVEGTLDSTAAPDAIRTLLSELQKLRDQPLSRDELSLAKLRVSVEIRSMLSDNATTAELVSELFKYDASDLLTRWERLLAAASVEQVRDVARRYLHPDRVDIVVFGDARYLYEELSHVGSVELFRVTDVYPLP
jgi:zinc protease